MSHGVASAWYVWFVITEEGSGVGTGWLRITGGGQQMLSTVNGVPRRHKHLQPQQPRDCATPTHGSQAARHHHQDLRESHVERPRRNDVNHRELYSLSHGVGIRHSASLTDSRLGCTSVVSLYCWYIEGMHCLVRWPKTCDVFMLSLHRGHAFFT
jgi:hypothetical protein